MALVSGTGTLDQVVIPLQTLYLMDTTSGLLAWQSRLGEHNRTLQVNNSVREQQYVWRNESLYAQRFQPRAPSAAAIGTRVIVVTSDARLCEYDSTSHDGELIRCTNTSLPEVPNDIVHLPPLNAQDGEKLLLALPHARTIGLVDYESMRYMGTWASFQQRGSDLISMEYLAGGQVLVAVESRDAVLLYNRQGVPQPIPWVSVPRPRFISVAPLEQLVYVQSVEQDECAVYAFRTSDASSVSVSPLGNCDTQRQQHSFGVDVGLVYALHNPSSVLRTWSLRTGREVTTGSNSAAPMSFSPAALTRSDDETGRLGLVDSYSWHASVPSQPLVLAACTGGGDTRTSQTLGIYACRQQPDRMILVDRQSAYAMYRQRVNSTSNIVNNGTAALEYQVCFQRHFAMGQWISSLYQQEQDLLQLIQANGEVFWLQGVCADASQISVMPANYTIVVHPMCSRYSWCAWDSMRQFLWWRNDTDLYRHDGTLVSVPAPMSNSTPLVMDQGQLFALVLQDTGVQLFWLRVLDENVTRAEWIDAGQVSDQVLDPSSAVLLVAVRAYEFRPPPASEVFGTCSGLEECVARKPWLLGLLVAVTAIFCGVLVCVVLMVICRKRREHGKSSHEFATAYHDPSGSSNGGSSGGLRGRWEDCSGKAWPTVQWAIRQLFCGCEECYEDAPPHKLKFCYCCLGGRIEEKRRGSYVRMDAPGSSSSNGGNVYIDPDSNSSFGRSSASSLMPPESMSSGSSADPQRSAAAPDAASASASLSPPTMPAASGDSFTGRQPMTDISLHGH